MRLSDVLVLTLGMACMAGVCLVLGIIFGIGMAENGGPKAACETLRPPMQDCSQFQ